MNYLVQKHHHSFNSHHFVRANIILSLIWQLAQKQFASDSELSLTTAECRIAKNTKRSEWSKSEKRSEGKIGNVKENDEETLHLLFIPKHCINSTWKPRVYFYYAAKSGAEIDVFADFYVVLSSIWTVVVIFTFHSNQTLHC